MCVCERRELNITPNFFQMDTQISGNSPFSLRASNTFNQVVEAKRFEGVFLCRKVC